MDPNQRHTQAHAQNQESEQKVRDSANDKEITERAQWWLAQTKRGRRWCLPASRKRPPAGGLFLDVGVLQGMAGSGVVAGVRGVDFGVAGNASHVALASGADSVAKFLAGGGYGGVIYANGTGYDEAWELRGLRMARFRTFEELLVYSDAAYGVKRQPLLEGSRSVAADYGTFLHVIATCGCFFLF